MNGRKLTGLILFGLIDVLLITGIILYLRQSGVLRHREVTAAEAGTAGDESISSVPVGGISESLEEEEEPAGGQAESEADDLRTLRALDSAFDEVLEEPAESMWEEPTAVYAGDDVLSHTEEPGRTAAWTDSGAAAEEPAETFSTAGPESVAEPAEKSGAGAEAQGAAELPPTKRCYTDGSFWEGCPERDIQLLTPNPFSRPQYALEEVNDIVIHYVGNPGSTAQQNRDYFESLKDGSRSASSHFVIGLEGEIIQCVSCSEWAYASNNRNSDTISIECCHPDESGQFTDATYRSLVELTAWLCRAFETGPGHVIRHYDVTGKNCPKYYVEHEDAWEQFLSDVKARYNSAEEQAAAG